MHPITTPSGSKYLIVEVPEDAKTFRIRIYPRSGTWFEQTDSKELNAWKVKLPKGDYEIIGEIKSDSMDEGVKEMVKEKDYDDYYWDYTEKGQMFSMYTWQSSVRSLLSHNKIVIKEGSKLLIIKKV